MVKVPQAWFSGQMFAFASSMAKTLAASDTSHDLTEDGGQAEIARGQLALQLLRLLASGIAFCCQPIGRTEVGQTWCSSSFAWMDMATASLSASQGVQASHVTSHVANLLGAAGTTPRTHIRAMRHFRAFAM